MARRAAATTAVCVLVVLACATTATADCEECWGKSSGPCRHDKDWSCFPYASGTTCPAGTTECKPSNCEVSAWGVWGKCDAKCDGGMRMRSRTVTKEGAHGGEDCPELEDWEECNTFACKDIAKCTDCTKATKGPCQDMKTGMCSGLNKHGECDAGSELCAPVDCEVSEWSMWSKCSATCGGGAQSRSRAVVVEPANGGDECPALSESRACHEHDCQGCAGCSGKTYGPCKADAKGDDTCYDFVKGTEQCPKGTTACVVKGDDLGSHGGTPGKGECSACFGKSSGPCMHDAAPVCHAFMAGTTTCPPGTHLCGVVNCEVSEWSEWSKCSATCGGGMQSRVRSVSVKPMNGGTSCPALEETQACSTDACVPQCGACRGKSSGPCQHTKDGTCFAYVKGTKDVCPAGTRSCDATDCVVGEWSKFSSCTAPCGGGEQIRSREVLVKPSGGGSECPALTDTQMCNTHKCDVCTGCLGKSSGPCQHTAAPVCYDYYPGTTDCPAGTVDCTKGEGGKASFGLLGRKIGKPGDGMWDDCVGRKRGPCRHDKKGTCHPFIKGTKRCPKKTSPCVPVNCEVSEWSRWTKCTASCSGGSQTRYRKVVQPASNGGAKCPDLKDTRMCNTMPCKAECSKCAKGSEGPCQFVDTGVCCDYDTQRSTWGWKDGKKFFWPGRSNVCPKGAVECKVRDCVMSSWSEWSKCSATCGGGSRSRTRTVLVEPSANGKRCPKQRKQTETCNAHACSSCTDCLAKTDGPCQDPKTKVCCDLDGDTCPTGTVNCKDFDNSYEDKEDDAGESGDGYCSRCTGGTAGPCRHKKTGRCAMYEGWDKEWDGEDWEDDVDRWDDDEWDWDDDDEDDDDDKKWNDDDKDYKRKEDDDDEDDDDWWKKDKKEKKDDGSDDDRRRLTRRGLAMHEVPTRAQRRARTLRLRSLKHKDAPKCPKYHYPCTPVSCEVSKWSKWSKCSASCGGGTQSRTRKVKTEPRDGGMQCPPLKETRACNTDKCGVDCSASCTKGSGPCRSIKYKGKCMDYDKYGKCPKYSVECVSTDCEVTEWSKWGKCSARCGGGTQARSRAVAVAPSNGGAKCPHLSEDQDCNTHKCIDCIGCAGKSSGPCKSPKTGVCHEYYYGTTTCPRGTRKCDDTYDDTPVGEPGDGMCTGCAGDSSGPCRFKDGTCCEYLWKSKTCPSGSVPCKPVSCKVSAWSAWGKCSARCAGGTQTRSRTVLIAPENGGDSCPHLSEEQTCNQYDCKPMCSHCYGKTSGPCRHTKDNSCTGVDKDGRCPAGTMPCNDVDCAVSEWGSWSKCNALCGGGLQSRSRHVVTKPEGMGKACPELTESQACNEHSCLGCVGCAGGTSGTCRHDKDGTCWDFVPKTKQCPAGTTACSTDDSDYDDNGNNPGTGSCDNCPGKSSGPCRHRKDGTCYAFIFGTKQCPAGTEPCQATDCVVGEWGGWGKCSASCDGGWQSRFRKVLVPPTDGGAECPYLEDSRICNTQMCDPLCGDCSKGWGPCRNHKDWSCTGWDKGVVGKCPSGTKACEVVDCWVSQWSEWGACSATCGSGGQRKRARVVEAEPSPKGYKCPALEETEPCNDHPCSDCVACAAKTHGPCQDPKTGVCFSYKSGTSTCPSETTRCADKGDSYDDKGDEGGDAGDGMCRGCTSGSSGNCQRDDGKCFSFLEGSTTCPVGSSACVPEPCVVSAWTEWTECSANCGGGYQSRSRSVVSAPQSGGMKCPLLFEERKCNYDDCQPECTYCSGPSQALSKWPCRRDSDGTCQAFMAGTNECPDDTYYCAAPVNCEVSEWSMWSKCSAKCGGGWQTRTRQVTASPRNGGKMCPPLEEGQACNTAACSSCAGCAGGTKGSCMTKTGVCMDFYVGTAVCPYGSEPCVAYSASFGDVEVLGGVIQNAPAECTGCFGKSSGPCQHDKDSSCYSYFPGTTVCPPGTHACAPTNCLVGEWSEWSKCSAQCGGGLQTRARAIKVEPSNGGLACPDLVQEQACHEDACTSACDECSSGSGPCQAADGSCAEYKDGSSKCPTGYKACAAVDCEVSEWSEFGACSATCGGGVRERTRKVTVEPVNGGAECPHLRDVEDNCNDHPCNDCADCLYKSSGPCMHDKVPVCYGYYAGTTVCPAGTHECSETLQTLGAKGGLPGDGKCSECAGKSSGPCRHNKDGTCFSFFPGTTLCPPGTTPCKPTGCKLSAWSPWGKCSAKCGGGTRSRSRSVLSQPKDGGMKCPDALEQTEKCNTDKCGATKEEAPQCGACAGKSSGPCRHEKDDSVCYDYYFGTTLCPAGTTACVMCEACAGKSSGPCRHDKDGTCHAYTQGTQCPAGTSPCDKVLDEDDVVWGDDGKGEDKEGEGEGEKDDGMCTGCWLGTSGPCQSSNTVCYGFYKDSTTCPAGTVLCAKKGSLPPKHVLVFDVNVAGVTAADFESHQEAFVTNVANAAGVSEAAVVIESVTDGNGINVGFVVVTDTPAASQAGLSAAADANVLGDAMDGQSALLGVQGRDSDSSSSAGILGLGMSPAVVAMVAVGIATVGVVGALIVVRRSSGSARSTTTVVRMATTETSSSAQPRSGAVVRTVMSRPSKRSMRSGKKRATGVTPNRKLGDAGLPGSFYGNDGESSDDERHD